MSKRVWKRLLLLTLAASMLSGCGQQYRSRQRILEKLGVISGVGYDKAEDGYILGSALLPNFIPTGQEQVDVLTAKARTSKECRFNLSRQTERKLVSGQIRVVLYGEDLAKQGILPLSDTLFRDAEIGSQIHLAIVQGRAVDFFLKRFPDKPSTDLYLYQLLRKEMEENSIPQSNLHLFLRDAYDSGKDAILPYLRLGSEDAILDGLAVFKDDKMVGRLSAVEGRVLSFMMGKKAIGEVTAELPESSSHSDHARVVLMYLSFKKKIDVTQAGKRPKFQIHLQVTGAVSEYTGAGDLEKPDAIKQLETLLAAQLQKDANAVLHKLQKEFRSDPMGFGEMYRAKGYVQDLKKADWRNLYQQADIGVDVKIRILQTGMIH